MKYKSRPHLMLVLCLLLLSLGIKAQKYSRPQIDSIWQNYRDTELPDSIRFYSITDLGNYIYRDQFYDLDSAELCHRLAVKMAKELESVEFLASAYNNLGTVLRRKNRIDSSRYYQQISADTYQELEQYGVAAGVHYNMGMSYGVEGDYISALEHFEIGLNLLDKQDHQAARLMVLHGIAKVYIELEYFELAEEFLLKTLAYYETENIPKDLHYITISRDLANVYQSLEKQNKALKYYLLSLKTNEKVDSDIQQKMTLNMLTSYYLDLNELEKADSCITASEKIKVTGLKGINEFLHDRSKMRLAKARGDHDGAFEYAKKAHKFAKLSGDIRHLISINYDLYQFYKKRDNIAKALATYEAYQLMVDSNRSIEKKEAGLKFKYKMDYQAKKLTDSLNFINQKELLEVQHQAKLTREAYFKYLLFALVVVLVLVTIILVQRYRNNQKMLDSTFKKLDHKTRDLHKVAEITKSRNKTESDLMMELQTILPTINSEDRAKLLDVLRNKKWQQSDWLEENHFLQDLAVSGSSEFESRLLEIYPDLTKADLELCGYLKANYSTKKIAQLRNVSTDAIKKAKQRLRKKLDTEAGADLYAAMQRIDSQ